MDQLTNFLANIVCLHSSQCSKKPSVVYSQQQACIESKQQLQLQVPEHAKPPFQYLMALQNKSKDNMCVRKESSITAIAQMMDVCYAKP